MAIGLVIDVRGTDLRDALRKVRLRTSNMRPYFRALGEHLVVTTRQRFDTESAPDGTKWPEISDAWRKRKIKEGRSPKIMTYTGRLKQHIEHHETDRQLIVGTNVTAKGGFNYPEYQQFVKKRVFLGLSAADRRHALVLAKEFIKNG
jgi:phage virion morphogenesis protein